MNKKLYSPALNADSAAAWLAGTLVPSSSRWGLTALRKAAAVALLGLGCMSAQAAAVYTFTSAPVIALSLNDRGSLNLVTQNLGLSTYGATLTFNAALAPNTTTAISAEYGGFDLLPINGASTGAVQSFTADADVFGIYGRQQHITSQFGDYATDPQNGDQLRIGGYSTVEGSLTTDAAGNIAGWDLNFRVWQLDGGNGTVCAGPACTPSINILGPDIELAIRSGATRSQDISYNGLDGQGPAGRLTLQTVDTALAEPGTGQKRSFTGAQGGWTVTGAVDPGGTTLPEPGTVALGLLAGGLALLASRRRDPEECLACESPTAA